MKIKQIKTEALIPYAKNARTHSDIQVQQIAHSISEFGFTNPVLVDDQNQIIAGHGRVMAAKLLGLDTVPTISLGYLSERQRRAYVLADNKIAMNSGWDFEMLASEISELTESGFDIDLLGFNEQEIDALLQDDASILPVGFGQPETIEVKGHLRTVGSELNDDVPEVMEDPKSSPGQVWLLGDHKLMCGDSTSSDDVARLMTTDVARLMTTDPPYGVSYVGKTKEALVIQNDALTEEGTHLLWKDALDAFWPSLDEGGVIYASVPAGPLHIGFANELKVRGALRQILVWDKLSMVLGHSDYHYKHEPILYGWKPGKAHYFINDRTKTTVLGYQKPNANRLHPTMKPIELWAELINNSSQEGDVVCDMFGGAGVTIIACEELGRRARVMELDPRYVDVIINRWQSVTGKGAILESTGQTFNSL
jgi:DNA modification methylase